MGNYSSFCFNAFLKKACTKEIKVLLKAAFNRKSQYEPAGFPRARHFLNYIHQGKILSLEEGHQLVKIDCAYRGFSKIAIEFVEWITPYIFILRHAFSISDTGRIIIFLDKGEMDCTVDLLGIHKIQSENEIEEYE